MALFERERPPSSDEYVARSEAATRALSRVPVEKAFVEGVYEKLASVYDVFFGPTLHPGRKQAIKRMGIRPEHRILEVGVGTGINAPLYPRECAVTGVDLSAPMLEKARERVARKALSNVRLIQMDASDLRFPDNAFDIVYAPYLITVVPDPVRVASEMRRVCRPGGRIIFLNHFLSENRLVARLERLVSPLTVHVGFKSDIDLHAFLSQAGLQPVSVEKVNIPPIMSLVTCVKD
jgi:phosphatidylethanolamine/phosphatidyl-N-methylethanolamine N-methyltransferase